MADRANILVLYYSATGNVAQMAHALADGALVLEHTCEYVGWSRPRQQQQ